MRRREFVAAGALMFGPAIAPALAWAPDGQTGWLERGRAGSRKQAIAVQLRVVSGDRLRDTATLAPDYVLLEHGELQGVADDEKNMKARPATFKRTEPSTSSR